MIKAAEHTSGTLASASFLIVVSVSDDFIEGLSLSTVTSSSV